MAEISSQIQSMPKAELHAHLNGSISDTTLQQLSELKKSNCPDGQVSINISSTRLQAGHQRTFDECFEVFRIIHQLTDTQEAVKLATRNVIMEFAQDNVFYLELRTTPRQVDGIMTYQQYLDAVLQAIDQCRAENLPILVKLLPSIDRSRGVAVAERVVDVTLDYSRLRPDVVVGLDVSGQMSTSDVVEFFPLLEKVRRAGLQLAIHTAEVHNDPETEAILRFRPDRIGHGTYIPPIRCNNPKLLTLLKESHIPIELCLTSNVLSRTVSSYEDHHLKTIMENDIPFTLSTDDCGVFGTTLTNEYIIAATVFDMSLEQLWNISRQTLNYAFNLNQVEKQSLIVRWEEWHAANIIDRKGEKNEEINETN